MYSSRTILPLLDSCAFFSSQLSYHYLLKEFSNYPNERGQLNYSFCFHSMVSFPIIILTHTFIYLSSCFTGPLPSYFLSLSPSLFPCTPIIIPILPSYHFFRDPFSNFNDNICSSLTHPFYPFMAPCTTSSWHPLWYGSLS